MSQCKPAPTPVTTPRKLSADTGSPYDNPTLHRSLAGALQYLTFTRPDISYAVQQVCLFMHDPRVAHMTALHRVLRYVKGTLDHGQQLYKSSISSIFSTPMLIGVVVLTPVYLPLAIVFYLVII